MITIVTDSSSYLRERDAQILGVRLVPMTYTVRDQLYYESFSDRNGDFVELLNANVKCTTSHPNANEFLNCFHEELAKNNEVLCLTISARLSGTHISAMSAAMQTESDKIVVIDSRMTAGGLFLLIKEAKKLIDSGLGLQEILPKLPAIRDRITIAFSVEDMTPLRNSGRIGFVRLGISTILNYKPILMCVDGAVEADSVARGTSEIIEKLMGKIADNVQEIVINYIGENQTAANLYFLLKEAYPQVAMSLKRIGPVLGIHLGLHVVGVASIRKCTDS